MINDISNINNIYDVSYTPRPEIILYDISSLNVKYKTAEPGLVKLSKADKDYLAEWRLKQSLIFQYVYEYVPRDSEIEDPDPFTDVWYIFNINPLVQKAFRKFQKPSIYPPKPPLPKPGVPKPSIPKPTGPKPLSHVPEEIEEIEKLKKNIDI